MGKPLEPTRVNRALKKSLHAVGIKHHIRVHDLRHTSASLALRRGIAGKVVQEILGHSNYSTTMDIYSHVDPDMHKEASKQKGRGGNNGAQEGTQSPTFYTSAKVIYEIAS